MEVFARPWWVNLGIFIPFLVLVFFWGRRINLPIKRLAWAAVFGISFGFVEAVVVVYLRQILGFPPGSDISQGIILNEITGKSLSIEFFREISTMLMLVSVAYLSGNRPAERILYFLWSFAVWDISYYLGLILTIGWPRSLLDQDVLFLVPVPWSSQVWFPILVSSLTILAISFLTGWTNSRPPEGGLDSKEIQSARN